MLCENCKKNNATTYFKQIVNGEETENFLCSECAKKLGISGSLFNSSSLFGGFEMFFPELSKTRETKPAKTCSCGKSFMSIAKTGLVGCQKCYETFKEEFLPTLKKMHGNTKHKPRLTPEKAQEMNEKAKISSLREKMAKAIKEEDFEEAARLRDEIRLREKNI